MPVGFGKSVRSNGRPLAEMVYLKRSIIEVKAKSDCLADALIIAIARIQEIRITSHIDRGIRYHKRFNIYYRQPVLIYNTGEVSQNSRDSKITFQSTESLCTEA